MKTSAKLGTFEFCNLVENPIVITKGLLKREVAHLKAEI